MKQKNRGKRFAGMLVMALTFATFFVACATTIPVPITQPPRLDMSGIKRITILPFKTSEASPLQDMSVAEISKFISEQISATGRFTLNVIAAASTNAIVRPRDYSNTADAVVYGEIVALSVKDGTGTMKVTRINNASGIAEEWIVPTYDRDVNLTFVYRIARTQDGSIIGEVKKSGRSLDSKENKAELSPAFGLVQKVISNTLKEITGDMEPKTLTENRSLINEGSQNMELRTRMDEVLEIAKAGKLPAAIEAYRHIYAQYNNFAAAYNEAILTESTEGIEKALELMSRLAQTNSNRKEVHEALAKMRAVQAAYKRGRP
jgi:hypothetical protein